ncbi:MAG: RagB/SusD family nutrient uptake outer membrane protein [Bacteroides xylanisolvens]
MKKIKYIIIALLAIQWMTVTSCSDWLDLMPYDGVPSDEYWKTKEDVRAVVNGAYLSMTTADIVQRMFLYGEWRADMVGDGKRPNSNVTGVFNGEISPENTFLDWSSFYNTINICNTILKYAPVAQANDPSFSETQLKEYEAQAIAIRSLMYFYLVRSFGDVPLVLEAYSNASQPMSIAKTSQEEILDVLVSDLTGIEQIIPSRYSTTDPAQNKGRMTVWAVKALLADIYLWKEEYENCYRKCNEIIESGQFTLIPVRREEIILESSDEEEEGEGGESEPVIVYHPDQSSYYSLFDQLYYQGNSAESIFEIQFSTEGLNPFYTMMSSSRGYLGVKVDHLSLDVFIPTGYEDTEYFDIRSVICQKKNTIWKYIGIEPNGTERAEEEFSGNYIIYRLAEIYLMKAEALTQMGIQAGDNQDYLQEARDILEKIRERSNAVEATDLTFQMDTYDGKTMEKFVLEERGRELIYEGKRWFDVLRQAKRGGYEGGNLDYLLELAQYSAPADKVSSLQSKYRNYHSHYLPIYSEELDVNPLLVQNEFYAN